jgi:hypothetical protein
MSTLDSKAGISKPPRAKPTATASIFLADMRANGACISAKMESTIRRNFNDWITENKKNRIRTSSKDKKKKILEIATTILNFSRSQSIFDDLSDLEPQTHECSCDFFNITLDLPEVESDIEPQTHECSCDFSNTTLDLPEVDLSWMVEKKNKKIEISLPAPIQPTFSEPSLSRTLRRILFTNFLIHYYLNDGQYKN